MYAFSPPSNKHEKNFAFWRGAFTSDELDAIVKLGEKTGPGKASVMGGASAKQLKKVRRSNIAWIEHDAASRWLYEKLVPCIRDANDKFFGFDLWGFHEHLQYTVYESKAHGHYDWHVDSAGAGTQPRKLSMVIMLTPPTGYEGGELWLQGASDICLPKEHGTIYFFPSYMRHRVTPVTKGTRRSLVGWITGPEFR